jgi:O-succinylbenzoate synthase
MTAPAVAGRDRRALVIRSAEIREVALPLVRPFRTSFGEEREKRAILIRVDGGGVEGWGECVAGPSPRYSEEWLAGAWIALSEQLLPSMLGGGPVDSEDAPADRMAWARGHRMSKAGVEAAVLDALLRLWGQSLAGFLGSDRDRVPCGVSVGIAPSTEALVEQARAYVAQGYRRVKLKIEPGWDVEPVRAVREALPATPLSVDANGAYRLEDAVVFEALDEMGLAMIEQPLDHEDLVDHATLQARLRTPICLDESIRSSREARAALGLGACRIVNIKPGRVGGILESRRIAEAAQELGAGAWIGGMLETGVGRAVNLALAAMPGVTMPGDTSASDRYFEEDITEPFVLAPDGTMAVPAGPGIGAGPLSDRLAACTVRTQLIRLESTDVVYEGPTEGP